MTTTFYRNMIIKNMMNIAPVSDFPTTYYIGLSSTEPNETGSNVTEPSGGGYARVALGGMTEPENGETSNSGEIDFPKAETDWFPSSAPATHYVIYDQLSEGNLLMYGLLTKSRIVESDTYISFPTGELTITVE